MKLENQEWQVPNLKLSQKLKYLGVKQESLWYWIDMCVDKRGQYKPYWQIEDSDMASARSYNTKGQDEQYSAFTVAELGEMLPFEIAEATELKCHKDIDMWILTYTNYRTGKDKVRILSEKEVDVSENEADARAKMLIYLIENKLLEGKKL